GRFISRDLLKSIGPKSVNPYQYAWDNPMRFVDSSGARSRSKEKRDLDTATIDLFYAERALKRALKADPSGRKGWTVDLLGDPYPVFVKPPEGWKYSEHQAIKDAYRPYLLARMVWVNAWEAFEAAGIARATIFYLLVPEAFCEFAGPCLPNEQCGACRRKNKAIPESKKEASRKGPWRNPPPYRSRAEKAFDDFMDFWFPKVDERPIRNFDEYPSPLDPDLVEELMNDKTVVPQLAPIVVLC
ncbi:MAG: hypothetical protein JSU70_09070, partial [Phycisphaerales bacterium]